MITEDQPGVSTKAELYEILDQIDKSDEPAEVVRKFGKQYSSFQDYLRCVFDDRIQFTLPEGKPPYRPADPSTYPSTWHKKHMDLKYFVTEQMSQIKREMRFINMLESIHPEDAVIVCEMIGKRTPSNKLTAELAKEVFPNLFS